MYAESFASKLKFARHRTGFTQREVSAELNITQSILARYETGALEPNIETLGKLINFYGVSANWLLGTSGENSIYNPKKERNQIEKEMADNEMVGIKKSKT